MNQLRLYRHPISGHCHRVETFMSILGLEYELINLDLSVGEHKQPEFLSKNRFGQIPVLEDGECVLSDSNAILIYLAQKYDLNRSWFPESPDKSAEVVRFLSLAAGKLAYGPAAARAVNLFGAPLDHEALISASHSLFSVLDDHLNTKEWLVGDNPTIADLAVYAYVLLAPEGGVSLDEYTHILSWLRRVSSLSEFVPMQLSKVGLRV